MSQETDRFQKLKDDVARANTEIAQIQGERKGKVEQYEALLAKHGCKNLEELKAKAGTAMAEAKKVEEEAETFVRETGQRIKNIQTLVAGGTVEKVSGPTVLETSSKGPGSDDLDI